MTMAGDLDLSSLPKIPVKPHPPLSNSSSVVDCMWSPSFPHPWLLAHCNERLFYSPPSLTPITITTLIHPKDLSLFALSPKNGGR